MQHKAIFSLEKKMSKMMTSSKIVTSLFQKIFNHLNNHEYQIPNIKSVANGNHEIFRVV